MGVFLFQWKCLIRRFCMESMRTLSTKINRTPFNAVNCMTNNINININTKTNMNINTKTNMNMNMTTNMNSANPTSAPIEQREAAAAAAAAAATAAAAGDTFARAHTSAGTQNGHTEKSQNQHIKLPIVDVTTLTSSNAYSERSRKETAKELHQAAEKYGIFYIIGHNVPDEILMKNAMEQTKIMFEMTQTEKNKIAAKPGHLFGYAAPDERMPFERVHMHALVSEQERTELLGGELPDTYGKIKTTLSAYTDAMLTLSQSIMHGFAMGLNMDQKTLIPTAPFWILRPSHYLKSATATTYFETYTDYSLFSITNQDVVEGCLQIKNNRIRTSDNNAQECSEFVNVKAVPGCLVVNIGDIMEYLTGGVYSAVPTRICLSSCSSEKTRGYTSLPFLYGPNLYTKLNPLQSKRMMVGDTSASQFPSALPLTYAEHLTKKVLKVLPAGSST